MLGQPDLALRSHFYQGAMEFGPNTRIKSLPAPSCLKITTTVKILLHYLKVFIHLVKKQTCNTLNSNVGLLY